MPGDPPVLSGAELDEAVVGIIAEVLMVPLADVQPASALIDDLGAESIDFLDLVFRIEELLGHKIPIARWEEFARQELGGDNPAFALTVRMVQAFATEERRRPR